MGRSKGNFFSNFPTPSQSSGVAKEEEEGQEDMDTDEMLEFDIRSRLQNNPKMPPPRIAGMPLRVFTGIYIESMSNFQAAQMVRTKWLGWP